MECTENNGADVFFRFEIELNDGSVSVLFRLFDVPNLFVSKGIVGSFVCMLLMVFQIAQSIALAEGHGNKDMEFVRVACFDRSFIRIFPRRARCCVVMGA